jgi:hypothetical protein
MLSPKLITFAFLSKCAGTHFLPVQLQRIFPVDGRVGIGATVPLAMFDINSGSGITPLSVVDPAGYLLVDNVDSGENYYKANSFYQFKNASGNPILTMF